jgi:hypothetical protein
MCLVGRECPGRVWRSVAEADPRPGIPGSPLRPGPSGGSLRRHWQVGL